MISSDFAIRSYLKRSLHSAIAGNTVCLEAPLQNYNASISLSNKPSLGNPIPDAAKRTYRR